MKPVSSILLQLLQTDNFLTGDLYSIILNDGASDNFSALDIPVVWDGTTYRSDGLRIEGLKLKLAVGLQVDSQTIRIGATPQDTLAGTPFLENVGQGLLDGAYILRSRAFWQRNSPVVSNDYLQAPVGVVQLTNMLVSEITKIGRTHVELVVKSPTKLLDLDMPRNYYSSGCVHTLFDAGCTLSKAAFANLGVVDSGGNDLNVPSVGGIIGPVGPDGVAKYAQGRLLFTSGALNNLQFSIRTNSSSTFALVYPLSVLPSPGDTFTAFPGCSKTMNTCNLKFNNLVNFRGFPFVPQVYVSV